jgi:S-methylmethionine transporter
MSDTAGAAGTAHTGLQRTMEQRHLVMIALGGVIGSGLFVSSGYTIGEAGPLGAVLAYVLGALVAWMVMCCLGELAVVWPVSGGFHIYASRNLGPAWGFATAWLYWLCWAVALGSEFTASGILMQRWFPGVDVWVWCVVFGVFLFALNAVSARVFGETEFWLSLIKVVAVLALIVVGAATIVGINPVADGPAVWLTNFDTGHGLFPEGVGSMLVVTLGVFYAFSGTELIGVAAGETKEPATVIPKAIRTAVLRLTVFFVGAIFVIAALVPYEDAGLDESPFVTVFDIAGIPGMGDVMNFVVIAALLSAGNSGLFSCTRMLHSMAAEEQAPKAFLRTTRRGIPMLALCVSMLGGVASLLSSEIAPGSLYMILVSIAGFAVVAVWIAIAASQLMFRRRFAAAGGRVAGLHYRAPASRVLAWVSIIALVASLIGVGFDADQREALTIGVPFTVLCLVYYRWRHGPGCFRPQGQDAELDAAVAASTSRQA